MGKGKTWSRGTIWSLAFAGNVILTPMHFTKIKQFTHRMEQQGIKVNCHIFLTLYPSYHGGVTHSWFIVECPRI